MILSIIWLSSSKCLPSVQRAVRVERRASPPWRTRTAMFTTCRTRRADACAWSAPKFIVSDRACEGQPSGKSTPASAPGSRCWRTYACSGHRQRVRQPSLRLGQRLLRPCVLNRLMMNSMSGSCSFRRPLRRSTVESAREPARQLVVLDLSVDELAHVLRGARLGLSEELGRPGGSVLGGGAVARPAAAESMTLLAARVGGGCGRASRGGAVAPRVPGRRRG